MSKRLSAVASGLVAVSVMMAGSSGTSSAQGVWPGGYYLVAADGGVFTFGDAGFYGSAAGRQLAAPVVGMTSDLHGDGYWLVGRDGGVFAFGNAPFLGSAVGLVQSPVVGIATVTAGGLEGGYVVAAADGTTVTFMPGSSPTITPPPAGLHGPVVAMSTSSANAGGLDLVTGRGQVVPEGPIEQNYGDPSGMHLAAPVVGIAVGGNNANHYQLAAADGGVFTYGTTFEGSAAAYRPAAPIVGTALAADGSYYLAGADGGIFAFGGAKFYGSAGGYHLAAPVTGMALP